METSPLSPNEFEFDKVQVEEAISNISQEVLENELFDEDKVHQWSNTICESSLEYLAKLEVPLKYIVTCIITQRNNGEGLHTAVNTDVDDCDKIVQAAFDDTGGKQMLCIVTAAGILI